MTVNEQVAAAFQVGGVQLVEKTFSTGSRGFNANGKVTIDGKRYQLSANLVEIGSKPVSKSK